MGVSRLAEAALPGFPVAWFAPIHKSITEVWRDALRLLREVISHKHETERRIELYGGGVLEFWSLTDPDSARGRKYKRAVVDEAAKVRKLEEAWNNVISPTLADYEGDAYFLSTPRGIDFFHTLYQWGQDPLKLDWASWQMPTSTNPFIKASEIERMRRDMPERVFAQEVLAIFQAGNGTVFRNIYACLKGEWQKQAIPGHRYVMGVDWGKVEDFTVLCVIDCSTVDPISKAIVPQLCYIERFNQIDYQFQLGRLREVYSKFKPSMILAEQNSMGMPLIEQLQRGKKVARPDVLLVSDGAQIWAHYSNGGTEGPFDRSFVDSNPNACPYNPEETRWGMVVDVKAPYAVDDPRLVGKSGKLWQEGSTLPGLPIYPFNTTNASKTEAIETLSLAFDREELQLIPGDSVLLGELAAFEARKTRSGLMSYSAPAGLHDDIVMALAIGYSAAAPYRQATFGPSIY